MFSFSSTSSDFVVTQSQGQCTEPPFSTVTNLFISNFADQIVRFPTKHILQIGHV